MADLSNSVSANGPSGSGLHVEPPADLQQVGALRRCERTVQQLRYHRSSQLVRRLQTKIRRQWISWTGGRQYQRAVAHEQLELRNAAAFQRICDRHLASRCEDADLKKRGADLLAGRFSFLGHERDLGGDVDWACKSWPTAPHLWRFHLHYHEWLLDLVAAASTADTAWRFVIHWIDNNSLSQPGVLHDAWHPYCISRRLCQWLMLWTACPPPAEAREKVSRSMQLQAHFLRHNLELDIGGNHLLENIRALLMFAGFFHGAEADRCRVTASRILEPELSRQVLRSGEHFERSPMYHLHVLNAVLDIAEAVEELVPEISQQCRITLQAMARFLELILHPDGDVPQFGDSCLAERPSPLSTIIAVRSYSSGSRSNVREEASSAAQEPMSIRIGEYWVFRNKRNCFILDCGPVGADDLPAHSHSDLLTFEASLEGQRVFVDTGVLEYQAGSARHYCRSTPAHNTVQVDGREQCDVWGQFRMGYRGHPLAMTCGKSEEWHWGAATHDAYRRIGISVVGRFISCSDEGPWVCIDWIEGQRMRRLDGWLHLHPDVKVSLNGPDGVRLQVDSRAYDVSFFSGATISIEQRPYYPRMGMAQPAPVIRYSYDSVAPPFATGWWLRSAGFPRLLQLHTTADQVGFRWQDADSVVSVPRHLTRTL